MLKKKKKKKWRKKPLPQAPDINDPRTRKCIATGVTASPDGFIRFVLAPDGVVAPDFSGKLPGRGAWVAASRAALKLAVKKGAFARSFKGAADTPDDFTAKIEAGLEKKALSALGMARKVGDVFLGFDQVHAALTGNKVAALIAASDGAADGKRKLRALARDVAVIDLFDGSALAAALGRDKVVHAALKAGPAAARFLREARRLKGFRGAAG